MDVVFLTRISVCCSFTEITYGCFKPASKKYIIQRYLSLDNVIPKQF